MIEDQSDPMDALIRQTAAQMREARDDREAIIATIRHFLDAGMKIVYSGVAMWEFFITALRRAGFDAQEQDRRTRIFSTVIMAGQHLPPDWPWHESDGPEPSAPTDRPRE
jgi:hypothetical protein